MLAQSAGPAAHTVHILRWALAGEAERGAWVRFRRRMQLGAQHFKYMS
jgi:hypothetical protein